MATSSCVTAVLAASGAAVGASQGFWLEVGRPQSLGPVANPGPSGDRGSELPRFVVVVTARDPWFGTAANPCQPVTSRSSPQCHSAEAPWDDLAEVTSSARPFTDAPHEWDGSCIADFSRLRGAHVSAPGQVALGECLSGLPAAASARRGARLRSRHESRALVDPRCNFLGRQHLETTAA